MGCKATKELIKKEVETIHNKFDNYITKDNMENVKSDIKNVVTSGLELVMPVIENLLIQKVDVVKKKEVSELTKSFVTNTFKQVSDKIEKIDNKVEEIDTKKVNKPIYKKNDDFIN